MEANGDQSSPPLVGHFDIYAEVQSKGKSRRDWTRTIKMSLLINSLDVNRYNGNHVHDVILLVVESFNNERLC